MFMMISFWRLAIACPFLPLYWVKPEGGLKLIGARRDFLFCVDFSFDNYRICRDFNNIQIDL
jgi:hypothetical protein